MWSGEGDGQDEETRAGVREGDDGLSLGVQQDIKMLSMPDCLQTSGAGRHSFNFAFRVRDKDCAMEERHFQHCFVSFRQCKDASSARGYFQQSVVLVSALPCVGLFYSTLDRLAAVLLEATPETSIAQTLQTAFQHFAQWPAPPGDLRQGPPLHMPFLGSVIAYNCPSLPVYMHHLREAYYPPGSSSPPSSPPSSSSSSGWHGAPRSGLDGGLGSYSDASLLSLQRWGLVPHLWTLWHLVLAGRRIVVYSPSAEVCSAVVLTLCSLTAPLAFAGDCRPYISAADSDVAMLAAEGAGGAEGACRLVGITNPFLLRAFKGYDAALFVPDELSCPGGGSGNVGGGGISGTVSLFRALALGSGGAAPPASSSSSGAAVLTARAKVLTSGPGARSLEEEHDRWAVKCGGAGGGGGGGGRGGGSAGAVAGAISGAVGSLASSLSRGVLGGSRRGARETLLCLRSLPPVAADPDASRRLQSVLGLGGAQAEVIGSMLLREHFRSLTLALLRPLEPLLLQLPPPTGPQVAIDVAPALAGLTGCLSAARGTAGRPPRVSAGAEVVLPPCLCVPEWKALLLSLGRSPHFQAWCRWRRQEAVRAAQLAPCC